MTVEGRRDAGLGGGRRRGPFGRVARRAGGGQIPIRAPLAAVLAAASLAGAARATPARAQTAVAQPAVVEAGMSADTVRLGDRFELAIDLRVPAGFTAYVPDLLPATDSVESVGAAGWTVEEIEGGGFAVAVRYPLVAFRPGPVPIPGLDVLVGPSVAPDGADGATPRPVLSERALGGAPGATEGLSRQRVPSQGVWVTSPLSLQDIAEGVDPRPADDVIGSAWNAPLVVSILGFASLLAGVVVVSGRDWLEAHARRGVPEPVADPIAEARAAALAELDRLLASELHRTGSLDVFYGGTSDAVRRYVEHLDPAWSDALTSTELMRGLEARTDPDGARELLDEMALAEAVKFGRARPDPDRAELHGRTLRDWVAAS